MGARASAVARRAWARPRLGPPTLAPAHSQTPVGNWQTRPCTPTAGRDRGRASAAAQQRAPASADRERRWARESVEAERKKKADEQRLKAIRSKA